MEAFWRKMKTEWLVGRKFKTLAEAKATVFECNDREETHVVAPSERRGSKFSLKASRKLQVHVENLHK